MEGTEVKEERVEDQKGEEAAAAAATAVECPNCTASALETGRDGEVLTREHLLHIQLLPKGLWSV